MDMFYKPYKPVNHHKAELISRIEDQLIEKFNNTYKDCDKNKYSKDELIKLVIEWAYFWYNERPIVKFSSEVAEMKKSICDLKIIAIYNYAEKLGISDDMPEMILS